MEKKYKLCPHNMIRMNCPICKDDIKDNRIDLLLEDESNIGRDFDE